MMKVTLLLSMSVVILLIIVDYIKINTNNILCLYLIISLKTEKSMKSLIIV